MREWLIRVTAEQVMVMMLVSVAPIGVIGYWVYEIAKLFVGRCS